MVGTGANGTLLVRAEVLQEAELRKVEFLTLPTTDAIAFLKRGGEDTNAILLVPCWATAARPGVEGYGVVPLPATPTLTTSGSCSSHTCPARPGHGPGVIRDEVMHGRPRRAALACHHQVGGQPVHARPLAFERRPLSCRRALPRVGRPGAWRLPALEFVVPVRLQLLERRGLAL